MMRHLLILSISVATIFGREIEPNWRIIGGTNAPEGKYVHQVSLKGPTGSHNCGGSIIKPTIILTAAHCVVGQTTKTITVYLGSTKLNSGGVHYGVKDLRPHQDYSHFTLEHDIAILKLNRSIEFSNTAAPITLEEEEVPEGTPLTLSGWGYVKYPAIETTNELKHVTLDSINNTLCQELVGSKKKIYDSQICTLVPRGQGTCQGDSGGPLIEPNGKQIGIASWGKPCGVGAPDIFTKVAAYKEWIKRNSY